MEIRGIIPPILTPMFENEEINYSELRNQVERMIDGGVHGVFCFGTNGESYILSESEKQRVLEAVVDQAGGRVPVYAGSGGVGTRETIRLSKMAKDVGADVLSIITPWFAAASQEELYAHYAAVADAVDLPIVLYNIPARTGNALKPATVGKLAKIDNIVGVKDSSGNFDNILQYIEATRGIANFSVLSGNDSLILWTLYAGGKGGIAGCANVYPKTMVSIYERFMAGDFAGARAAQDSVRSLRACFVNANPNTVIKTATAELGYPVGPCRKPFTNVSPETLAALRRVLAENKERGMD